MSIVQLDKVTFVGIDRGPGTLVAGLAGIGLPAYRTVRGGE